MSPHGARWTTLVAVLSAMVALSDVLVVSAAPTSLVAQSEDDLINGFKDPETQLILLKTDMVLTPAKWPGAVSLKTNCQGVGFWCS